MADLYFFIISLVFSSYKTEKPNKSYSYVKKFN